MVTLYYALRDFSRRKNQTVATIVCVAVSVASVTFLTLTGLSLRVPLTSIVWRMSIGLSYLFSRYLLISVLLSLAIGLVVLSSMMGTTIVQRYREIGVMKAIGLVEEVSSFFVAESVVIALSGCFLGILFGVAAYIGLVFSMSITGLSLPLILPLIFLSVTFASSSLISFAFTYLPLKRAVMDTKAIEAISCRRSSGFRPRLKMRTSFLFKIPWRSLEIEHVETLRTIATCFLCTMRISVSVFGGHVVTYTANTYIRLSIGENTILLAAPEMTDRYVGLLSFQKAGESEIDYLSENYAIEHGFVEWLESQPQVVHVDPRIIVEVEVFEMKYIEPIPGPAYRVVGDDRSSKALIVGVKPGSLTSDWVHVGRLLSKDDEMSVVIGDSMLDVVYDYKLERLSIFGKSFQMVGVCIDPLNMGYTVYIPFEKLRTLKGITKPNILLIEIEGGNDFLPTIQQKASEYGLRAVELRKVLEDNVTAVQRLWTIVSIIPSLSLISMTLALVNYLASTILGRTSDIKVMKAIGVKWRDTKKMIAIKVSLLVAPSCLIGIVSGLFLAVHFLVPLSVLPPWNALLLDLTAFGASVLLIFLGSFYFSTKLLRQMF